MNTVKEKRKIILLKVVSILVVIAAFALTVFTAINGSISIKHHSGTYVYNPTTNKSTCAITLEFNEPVKGDFTILFYDASGNLIYEEDCEVTEKESTHVINFVVYGETNRYVIDDYYFTTSDFAFLDMFSYILLVAAFAFVGVTNRLKCQSFYFNGQRIVVYVNVSKCYLKVNDVVYDEQKNAGRIGTTLFTCLENGDRVQAVIDSRSRIHLTVNDIACPPER